MNTGAPLQDRLEKLSDLVIHRSNHSSFESGHCALEVVAWLAGEPHSDTPECTCPTIASFVRRWNDGITDDARRTAILKPIALFGLAASVAVKTENAVLVAAIELLLVKRMCALTAADVEGWSWEGKTYAAAQ